MAGITITHKLIDSLMPPAQSCEDLINLDKYILPHLGKIKTDSDFTKCMNHLYKVCFCLFDKVWCKMEPTYIDHFDHVLSDVFSI